MDEEEVEQKVMVDEGDGVAKEEEIDGKKPI